MRRPPRELAHVALRRARQAPLVDRALERVRRAVGPDDDKAEPTATEHEPAPPEAPVVPSETVPEGDPLAPDERPGVLPFRSESCSAHHFLYDSHAHWTAALREVNKFHRKLWEFTYIVQSLWERDALQPGRRGLGFGVGNEPLTSLFASLGCHVTATDLAVEVAAESGWVETNQHAASLDTLNDRGICDPDRFAELVHFETADMNEIGPHLRDFDFCWSACALEHVGSIDLGLAFIENSIGTLRPGGVAVHTTELNLSSDEDTVDHDHTVLFRERDLRSVIARLRDSGHHVEPLLIHRGSQPVDDYVDVPPYLDAPHLRLRVGAYVCTSVGLIIRRAA